MFGMKAKYSFKVRTYHRVYSTGGRDHVVAWTSGAGGGC